MIFQAMLDASGLLPEAGRQLSESMVPIEFVVGFLPFLAGLVTGIAIGFAGPAFPLVVGLIAARPTACRRLPPWSWHSAWGMQA